MTSACRHNDRGTQINPASFTTSNRTKKNGAKKSRRLEKQLKQADRPDSVTANEQARSL
jgi:hypothetical protein